MPLRRGQLALEKHPRWKGGRKIGVGGYVRVLQPSHPACDVQGYVAEHRLVMEAHLGRYLTGVEIVHHINGVTSDNRIENLRLCKDRAEHARLHKPPRFCSICGAPHQAKGLCKNHWQRARRAQGFWKYYSCSRCGKRLADSPLTGLCFACYNEPEFCLICGERAKGLSLCGPHYIRFWKENRSRSKAYRRSAVVAWAQAKKMELSK